MKYDSNYRLRGVVSNVGRSPGVGNRMLDLLCSQLTACGLAPKALWFNHDHDKLFSLGTGVHRGLPKRCVEKDHIRSTTPMHGTEHETPCR